jgi:ribosomal protein S18 acetylase RimI-like enzyme
MYTIRNYSSNMKESWLRCRALAYMRSSFSDEITDERENSPVDHGVALVAIDAGQVVGIVDAVFLNNGEAKPESYGLRAGTRLTTLDAVATHPDYQHQGIARALIHEAVSRLRSRGGELLIYTLDDEPANALYRSLGAKLCYQASIVTAHSSHNLVPKWVDFRVDGNQETIIYDSKGNALDYAIDTESYYVGQRRHIPQLENVEKIVTENVYTLSL